MLLRFDMDVLAADLLHRSIEGVIVPYGEAAKPSGAPFPLRFAPGSIRAARARTPLLLDHDRGRPVGVLAALREGPTGTLATFRIDETPAGDEALTQAASGSRGAFSIGAELEGEIRAGQDGVADVDGSSSWANVLEVSLLALGAYAGAGVTRVAAEESEPEPEPEPDDQDDDQDAGDDEAGDTNPDQEEIPMEARSRRPVILAERGRSPLSLTCGAHVQILTRAQNGDRDAVRLLEAALTETISTDLTGVLPPQYERTILGEKVVDRALWAIFRGKALPGVGLTIQKPTWTTQPAGAWAANVDADATTSKAVIGLNPATVERWDWGTAISYVAAQRSDPDAIDAIYSAAVQDFYNDVETRIGALLTGTANAAVKLGDGIAAFYGATQKAPDVIIVAPDVWGLLADATMLQSPGGFGGVIAGSSPGTLVAMFSGVPIVASAYVAAGSKILVTRRALDVRISDPVRLTANAIGALNIELGVVGEGVFDTDYANEIMLLTAGAPVAAVEAAGR